MPEDTPTAKVGQYQRDGKTNTEIIQMLQQEGYTFQQISDALNQAQTQPLAQQAPEPPKAQPQPAAPAPNPPQPDLQPSVIYSDDAPVPTPQPEAVNPTPMNTMPSPSWQEPQSNFNMPQGLSSSTEDVEEIAESIINEKWQKLTEEFGDLMSWKEKITQSVDSVKQEVLRIENRFENLQHAVVGKVKEYDESVADVGVEIKALGKLLSNIINPLTNNVKELERLIGNLKK